MLFLTSRLQLIQRFWGSLLAKKITLLPKVLELLKEFYVVIESFTETPQAGKDPRMSRA